MAEIKSKNEELLCPKCGEEMSFRVKGSTAEWVCPNHGVMLVTTYATEEEMDSSIYSIFITKQEFSTDKIKLLSKLSSKNYIECKKVLDGGGELLEEKGWKLRPVLEQLRKTGIEFSTNPVFPYPLK